MGGNLGNASTWCITFSYIDLPLAVDHSTKAHGKTSFSQYNVVQEFLVNMACRAMLAFLTISS